MSRIPESWVSTSLGELGEWVGGGTPSKARAEFWVGGTIPWVSPKDMKRNSIDRAEDYITEEAVGASATQLIPRESVLVVTRSGILRHSLPVSVNTRPVAINQDLKALKLHAGINAEFVAAQMRANAKRILAECVKSGTTVESIEFDKLKAQPFRLAPTAEQERIVSKLGRLFAHTEQARADIYRVPELIRNYKRRLLAAAFSGDLTVEWRKKNKLPEPVEVYLRDVAYDFSYGSAAKSHPTGKVPVLRMGNIQDGRLDWSELVFTSNSQEIEKYKLAPGDVLFNRTNSPELVGKIARIPESLAMVVLPRPDNSRL